MVVGHKTTNCKNKITLLSSKVGKLWLLFDYLANYIPITTI